ncbi:MAG: hypothetical protein F6K65_37240 [Moorea sp. SIO3C2]|nr:hypothetical protein [Moorena sp. SIO3C2]
MVVPAAMPVPDQPVIEDAANDPAKDGEPPAADPAPKPPRPNPLAAMGIIAGWIKDVVAPPKPPPKPMLELPPRPPSIPRPASAAPDKPLVASQAGENDESEKSGDAIAPSPATPPATPPAQAVVNQPPSHQAPRIQNPNAEAVEPSPTTNPAPQAESNWPDDDEESNWPDDEFWE